MLKYFLENRHIVQVAEICTALNKTKEKLLSNSFEKANEHYDSCAELFAQIKELAIERNDEMLANSQLVFRNYFRVFCELLQLFDMLEKGHYKSSWDKLQDCLENIKYVSRFTVKENRMDLDDLYDLLVQYEGLYPYSIFGSSEYVISKSHCSICGQSMQSLDCPHIKGNIYWGEPAIECIDKIDVFQALCVVSHPEDKRCVLEMADDDRTEQEKFIMLHQYVELHQPALQHFSIEGFKERRIREDLKVVGRKQPCPCGSGKRFKHCCGKDMYYEHIRYVVTPATQVLLAFF